MDPVILPDGSAFALASYPLPKDHWLYAPREYAPGAEEPVDLPAPILTHALREHVVAAIRYAVRCATMCGQEPDFDPDALVQNAVYALCGPYARVSAENTQTSVDPALPQQPATGELAVSRNPFASRCYTMSESHLSGHRLIVGFEKLGDAQDAHEWVTRQGRGDFTHPAPSVPDSIDPPAEDGTEYDYCSGRAAGYAEGWNACRASMLTAKEGTNGEIN